MSVQQDYVVQQGTSGIWTYRKWNSGIAECWGYTMISVLCSNQSGTMYLSDIKSVALPTGLFAVNPIPNVNCTDIWSWVGMINTSTTSVTVKICRGSNYSQTYNTGLYLSVKGRWK